MRARALRVDVNLNVANNIVEAQHDIGYSGELFKETGNSERGRETEPIDNICKPMT